MKCTLGGWQSIGWGEKRHEKEQNNKGFWESTTMKKVPKRNKRIPNTLMYWLDAHEIVKCCHALG